jgi:hypothetical protein
MKKLLLGTVAIVGLMASAANAADMPLKAPPIIPPTCAGNVDIVRADNQIAVDWAAHYLDYLEFTHGAPFVGGLAGNPFDSEKGWQSSGVDVSGTAMVSLGTACNIYVSAEGSYVTGHTAYWSVPLTNTDGAKFWDGDFRLGMGFNVTSNAMLVPYLGGGVHEWSRDLVGPGGYHENYYHAYAGGGLLLQIVAAPRLVLSGYGLIGSTIDPYMQTSQNGGFPIVPMTFTLQQGMLTKAGASADFAFTDHIHANVGVDYTYFNYNESPPPVAGGAIEPNSRTSELRVKAGLGFGW